MTVSVVFTSGQAPQLVIEPMSWADERAVFAHIATDPGCRDLLERLLAGQGFDESRAAYEEGVHSARFRATRPWGSS